MTATFSGQGLVIGLRQGDETRGAAKTGRTRDRYRALRSKEEREAERQGLEVAREDIIHDDEGHLITIAPTGSGKGRSVIIPNLLQYNGPVIVVDPKGENYAVTSKYRRSIGHKIVRLDPFELCDEICEIGDEFDEPASLNPFDIMEYTTADTADDIRTVVEMASAESYYSDPFWPIMGKSLMSLAAQCVHHSHHEDLSLPAIKSFIDSQELSSHLKSLRDDVDLPSGVRGEINGILSVAAAQSTLAGIVGMAKSNLTIFSDPSVVRSTTTTSFDLLDVFESQPITVYIVIPVDKLASHQPLLRAWIGAFLRLMTSRKNKVHPRTLLMVDEAAQLGRLGALEEAITLARGYGVQLWSFWQDFSQVRRSFPESWETVLNNCAIVQFFGAKNTLARDQISSITGIDTVALSEVERTEQVVLVDGFRVCKARVVDYLSDENLKTRASNNPYYK